MTRLRKVGDDVLMAPRRGVPPETPEGYESAPGNPFVFLKILPDCEHREKKLVDNACCGPTERIFCKDQDQFVLRSDCVECKENVENITEEVKEETAMDATIAEEPAAE